MTNFNLYDIHEYVKCIPREKSLSEENLKHDLFPLLLWKILVLMLWLYMYAFVTLQTAQKGWATTGS